MTIAIIGAGYAGLATAFFLKKRFPEKSIKVFAKKKPSASMVSTGLLHCFLGKKARRSRMSFQALANTIDLLQKAQSYSKNSLYYQRGMLRLFQDTKIKQRLLQSQDPKVFSYNALTSYEKTAGALSEEGIFFEEVFAIESALYLQALKSLLIEQGVEFIEQEDFFSKKHSFSQIIYCSGEAFVEQFPEKKACFQTIKGQKLHIQLFPKLHLPFIFHADFQLIPKEDGTFILGSTYEKQFSHVYTTVKAQQQLIAKLQKFFPHHEMQVLQQQTAVRLSQRTSYLPYVKKLSCCEWAFVGLGSRGLLYHALYAKYLVKCYLAKAF